MRYTLTDAGRAAIPCRAIHERTGARCQRPTHADGQHAHDSATIAVAWFARVAAPCPFCRLREMASTAASLAESRR